jgi:hypothetical protein
MKRFQSQWFAGVVAVALASFTSLGCSQNPAGLEQPQAEPPKQPQKGTRMQGHVVRVQGPNQFVVRTADKREVILHVDERTKFLLNQRAARFTDIREKATVEVLFEEAENRNLASSVTITAAEEQTAEVVEGTIVRVVEADNQIVVRTASSKEVIVFVEEKTTFTVNERTARLVDFKAGMPVRVHVDARGNKNMARSVVTLPKR